MAFRSRALPLEAIHGASATVRCAALLLLPLTLGACGALLGLGEFTDETSPGTGAAGSGAAGGTGGGPTSSSGGGGEPVGGGGAGATGGVGGSGGSQAIPCAPGTNTNASGSCDVLDPGTCPAGKHCSYADDAGLLGCVADNAGAAGLGEPCSSSAECSGALECFAGKCSTFCCPGSDDPCDQLRGGHCALSQSPPNNPPIFVMACRFDTVCELLHDDCPDPATNCYPVDVDHGEAICAKPSPSASGEGGPCMFLNDCGESSLCAVGGICRQLCDEVNWTTLPVPTGGCPPNRTCMDVDWGPNNMKWGGIGVCVP